MISLVEHFFSFQGEGLYAGSPSIFFRFGGCNLGCVGFGVETLSPLDGSTLIGCDSQKAVDERHFKQTWESVDSDRLIAIVQEYERELNYHPDIVITGGEPLMHHTNIEMVELIEFAKSNFNRVTIETNASIKINFEKYPIYTYPNYSMSVKLENSGEKYEDRINPEAIEALLLNSNNSYFKFAVNQEYIENKSNIEIRSLTMRYPNTPIYIMPVGECVSVLQKNDEGVIEFCKQFGYNYTDRTHIRVYNKRDGV